MLKKIPGKKFLPYKKTIFPALGIWFISISWSYEIDQKSFMGMYNKIKGLTYDDEIDFGIKTAIVAISP